MAASAPQGSGSDLDQRRRAHPDAHADERGIEAVQCPRDGSVAITAALKGGSTSAALGDPSSWSSR